MPGAEPARACPRRAPRLVQPVAAKCSGATGSVSTTLVRTGVAIRFGAIARSREQALVARTARSARTRPPGTPTTAPDVGLDRAYGGPLVHPHSRGEKPLAQNERELPGVQQPAGPLEDTAEERLQQAEAAAIDMFHEDAVIGRLASPEAGAVAGAPTA